MLLMYYQAQQCTHLVVGGRKDGGERMKEEDRVHIIVDINTCIFCNERVSSLVCRGKQVRKNERRKA